jgi:signal transduction histidine kinase
VDESRPDARAWAVRFRRWHPKTVDAVLAFVVATVGVLAPAVDRHHGPSVPVAVQVGGAVVAFVLLLLRRTWTLMVLLWSVVGAVVLMALSHGRDVLLPVAVIVVFTVASETDRRTAWLAGAGTALVLFTAGVVGSSESWLAPANVGVIAWVGMATAVGDAVRSRRAYVTAVEERARRAEQTREEEARRQVAEERLRIARELHDVLAHHIALINVQAGVATHVLRGSPDQAEQALGHVRRASRAVLDELGALVNVLRDSEETTSPMEPAPGLGRLPRLLDSFGAAGLRVESVIAGQRRSLPAAVDVAAYRVVQEALTNVHKHGGGACARLSLDFAADELHITIANVGGAGPGETCGEAGDVGGGSVEPGTGHGIMGMRERAMSVGGWIAAGRLDGGPFRLEASLPLLAPAGGSRWEGDGHGDPGSAGR